MAKQNSSLYSISKTFIWFAIVSIILTLSLAAIVITDYNREWKTYQKKFVQLKLKKTRDELDQAGKVVDRQALGVLQDSLREAQKEIQSKHAETEALHKDVAKIDADIMKAKAEYQNLKQYQDSYKYYFEEYVEHHDKRASSYEKKLGEISPKVAKAKQALDALEAMKESKEAALAVIGSKKKELERKAAELVADQTKAKSRIENIEPTIAKEVLNAPMLDFLAPTLKIQQVVLENLYDDYHFAKAQKVDRCMTCHLGIDQKGFEDAPQPFRTHPNLDLYLSAKSPHALEKIGCTTCHGGNGHSVSFVDTAHTPRDETEKKRWQKEHGWRELEKWEHKMLPLQHAQAACAKCHSGVVEVPKADKLNEGRRLAQKYGCFGCHKITGFGDRWKIGPDLRHVASKLDAEWIAKWVEDPAAFKPTTQMPKVFNLSNTSSADDIERSKAAIQAITAYLIKHSEPVELAPAVKGGSAERGESLVKELGCLGCHNVGGVAVNDFGPDLTGLGDKLNEDWLYGWLKNPKHYSPNTRMPNLRLSDEEASDITAYLLTLRNENFASRPAPTANPAVIDEMVLNHLSGNLRGEQAKQQLSGMTGEEKLEYLGKKAIGHQGCFGCHDIKGFEDAKPIGAELSNEGRKDIHQFDFGFAEIEHTREAFIQQKLTDPRIFDHGKVKDYHDKLRMPQFNLAPGEKEALTTFVLSLTEEHIPLEMQRLLNTHEINTEKGRKLVAKYNCNGCHQLDGKTGSLREFNEDKGAAPPIIDGEGLKTQEKWLHEFLNSPAPIRPWVKYRMPTFGFTDEQIEELVTYFSNLDHQEITYRSEGRPATSEEKLAAGKLLFDKFQCAKCHEVNPSSAAMGASFLAPDLALSKDRLKYHWIGEWLKDPQKLQEGTMMPQFFPDGETPLPDVLGGDAEQQIEAIRDYLLTYESSDGSQN